MAHVEFHDVSKHFGQVRAIDGVDLEIEHGEFCALLGPSGCGKSTLLRMIAGLEHVTRGRIEIDGVDITDTPPAKRRIAMVFQSYALYPHMSVKQNISFAMEIAKAPKSEISARVTDVARVLQLENLLERRPAQLSGGQRQRVAIGRALVRNPQVFLFDEPLSNLDAMLRVQMRVELANLHKTLATTMIYVTHDQVEAMTLADRIVVLDRGRVSQIGSPLELYHKPNNRFVASFIGSPAMNFLPVAASTPNGAGLEVSLPGGKALKLLKRDAVSNLQPTEAGVRPEHVRIEGPETADGLPGKVVLVEHLGNTTIAHVQTGCGILTAQQDGDSIVIKDENVRVTLDPARVHLFGADANVI